MKSSIKNLPQAQAEIKIEIEAAEAEPYLKCAAQRLAKNAKIEGFRPGKAPYELIKNKFGEGEILKEALDDIVTKTYYQAVQEHKLETIGQPKIDLEKLAPGNPIIYRATVALLPKIKLGDYRQIKIARQPVDIKNEQVEQMIKDIQKMRAKESLADRPARAGDRLEIDFEIFIDQVPIEHGQHQKYPITIGEGRFIPGFEEQLVGLRVEATKNFELTFPENYYQKNLAGKQAEFRVKCRAVYQVELPALTDQFAQEISQQQFKDLTQMRAQLKINLEQEEKNKQEQKLEVEMFDQIIDQSEFETLPEILIDHEAHKMVHELEENISRQGLAFADYLKSINKNHDQLQTELKPQAEKRIKTALVCREIYQKEKMSVSDAEIERELSALKNIYANNPKIKEKLADEEYKNYLKNIIGNRKVVEYLREIIIK